MVSPLIQYASKDIDRSQYYLCGVLHPQSAGMGAATVTFLMYLACVIYVCCTGYWYAFTTLFIAVVCWAEFIYGAARMRKDVLEPLIVLSAIFTFAIAAHIGVFIYFTVASEGNGTEYKVVISFLSIFFVLNIICLRIMVSCRRFIGTLSTYLAHQGSIGAYSEDSVSSIIKPSPRSSINGSILSELPPKQGVDDQHSLAPSYASVDPQKDETPIMGKSPEPSIGPTADGREMEGYLNEVVNEEQPDLIKP